MSAMRQGDLVLRNFAYKWQFRPEHTTMGKTVFSLFCQEVEMRQQAM